MKTKYKLLSLFMVLSLVCTMNPIFKPYYTVQAAERIYVKEPVESIEWDDYEDLKLWDDVYEDMTFERWWQGPPEAPKIEVKEPEKPKTNKINMGEFKITYYCGCYECSEQWGTMTATGKVAKEGRTIAVDPSVIPYGTRVSINGHTYIAEDCGGAIKGNDIDIYLEDHDRVYEGGVDYYDVWIVRD